METIEHFAQISLVARTLGGERLLSRDEVMRLQGLRTMYGIAVAGADLHRSERVGGGDACQVVQAPEGGGTRLVADPAALARRASA